MYQAPNNETGPYDLYNAIVSQDKAQVVSTSWGLCEAQLGFGGSDEAEAESDLFAQAASQGQTIVAAAGDEGSEACYNPQGTLDSSLAVSDPAAQLDVTGVGGTSLSLNSSDQRSSEVVWNDGVSGGSGGGGVSSFWQMPSWQSGAPSSLNVIQSESSGCSSGAGSYSRCRQVPDVSADADEYTGYVVYYCGTCMSVTSPNGWQAIGGTSAAAPLWAALVAEADASSDCSGTGDLGFLNPALYDVAGSSAYSSAFNDVQSGNNNLIGNPGDYDAGTGYDMATGLGTPNIAALVPALCSVPGTPTSLTATGGNGQVESRIGRPHRTRVVRRSPGTTF